MFILYCKLFFFLSSVIPVLFAEENSIFDTLILRNSSKKSMKTLEDILKQAEHIKQFCYKYFKCNDCHPFESETKSLLRKPKPAIGPPRPVSYETGNKRKTSEKTYNNCVEILKAGYKTSGIYNITVRKQFSADKMTVYCDMETSGGGWIVLQRRGEFGSPHIKFSRTWNEYSVGFGNLEKEFWLGNENIFLLSAQEQVKLRIDLEDFDGNKRFALYGYFDIADGNSLYRLTVKDYSGNAGNSLIYSNGGYFATFDKEWKNRCAFKQNGGWWFDMTCNNACNLNGKYLPDKTRRPREGIWWTHWRKTDYSLKRTEMKIRPKDFVPESEKKKKKHLY